MRNAALTGLALILALLPAGAEPRAASNDTAANADTYKQLNLFGDVFERVRQDYVEPVEDKTLVENAINGMLSSLDPHSSYMNADSYRDMQVQMKGEFGGLGLQVTMENGLVKVISPIDDTPAAKADLKPNDYITAINSEPVLGMSLSDAIDKMRGPVNSSIKMTIRREGRDAFDVTLTRAIIKLAQSVKGQVQGNDIGYIRISSFDENTDSGLKTAIKQIQDKAGAKLLGYVIDLRNNPGGLLDQAVGVSQDFLGRGEIVSTRGRRSDDVQRYDAKGPDLTSGLPLVVLINGGSASASEIVAGALQDHKRAVLLGTKSFGKGSVQTIIPLGNQGAMRLTTARYYTPSGRSIQAKGIEPDVLVEPAKIELLAAGDRRREADLKGALRNTDPQAAASALGEAGQAHGPSATTPPGAPAATPPVATTKDPSKPDIPPGTTPAAQPPASVDSNVIGTAADYQLIRAEDMLRGAALFAAAKNGN